jgi:hypothetical protein
MKDSAHAQTAAALVTGFGGARVFSQRTLIAFSSEVGIGSRE